MVAINIIYIYNLSVKTGLQDVNHVFDDYESSLDFILPYMGCFVLQKLHGYQKCDFRQTVCEYLFYLFVLVDIISREFTCI